MRTVSPREQKGNEQPRRMSDDLRLIQYMLRAVFDYWTRGRRIRRAFLRTRKTRKKLILEELDLP